MRSCFRASIMQLQWELVACLFPLFAVATCGGKSEDDPGKAAQRVPQQHRAEGATCPDERVPGSVSVDYCSTDQRAIQCTSDAECTEGVNGRCSAVRPCMTTCSYDECLTDSDCADNQACACRPPSRTSANLCAAGNCRVDADCANGGFCSPSRLDFCWCPSEALCEPPSAGKECGDSCGHGYFCHTPQDSCLDDSDCSGSDDCGYDILQKRWRCAWPSCGY